MGVGGRGQPGSFLGVGLDGMGGLAFQGPDLRAEVEASQRGSCSAEALAVSLGKRVHEWELGDTGWY